jgi:glucose/arabinose dehydrogenase
VLRVTTAGAPSPGNPSLGVNARGEIFAYGYRNPQGLARRPDEYGGGMFTCEHGPNQDDEVTRLVGGGNAGWNPNDGAGNYNGYSGAEMTNTTQFPDAIRPLYRHTDSDGMSTCTFLRGASWKSWEGSLVVGFLAGERAIVLDVNAQGTGINGAARQAFSGLGRVRALTQGPDGHLYVAVDSGRIIRVRAQ